MIRTVSVKTNLGSKAEIGSLRFQDNRLQADLQTTWILFADAFSYTVWYGFRGEITQANTPI
jgi:hypothetical protein